MPWWERTKSSGKAGFDRVYSVVDKLGAPVNRLSNRLGSEAFWPTTLDKESEKAARILRSFCKDGFYQEETVQGPASPGSPGSPQHKQRVLKKIPAEVIRNAKGLAIFTTMRTGLWVSGAGGSGVLVGRLQDGSWSPPSGIMLHTAGLGFLIGVDIYDCVVVINTTEALEAFSKVRCTLGTEISAVAGPVGVGGILETEVHKRQAPIFTYLKSRGFYAGVQVDGTIVIERTDENERFYGEKLSVADILGGKVRVIPSEIQSLLETLRAAQGDTNVDESLLPSGIAPADHELTTENPNDIVFGVPDRDDPDPFGVLALEKAGLEIREAGTRARPSSEMFSFAPSPTSPIYSTFSRRSMDARSISAISSRPASQLSFLEPRPMVQMSDMSTQTDFDSPSISTFIVTRPKSTTSSTIPEDSEPQDTETPATSRSSVVEVQSRKGSVEHSSDVFSPKPSIEINGQVHSDDDEDDTTVPRTEVSATPQTPKSDNQVKTHESLDDSKKNRRDSKADKNDVDQEDQDENDDLDDQDDQVEIIDEPVVQQVVHTHTAAPQVISRPRLVVVNKPTPPKLPPRSPYRSRSSVPTATLDEAVNSNDETPSSRKNRQSVDSTASITPSVESVSSSIAKLRALNDDDETEATKAPSATPVAVSPSKENKPSTSS